MRERERVRMREREREGGGGEYNCRFIQSFKSYILWFNYSYPGGMTETSLYVPLVPTSNQ